MFEPGCLYQVKSDHFGQGVLYRKFNAQTDYIESRGFDDRFYHNDIALCISNSFPKHFICFITTEGIGWAHIDWCKRAYIVL